MTVFLKYHGEWLCFKGNKAIEKAKEKARRLYSMGISSAIYLKGNWNPILKY